MTNEQIRNLSRRDLSRALASARSRRDAFAAGREPADVLALVQRLGAEQVRRRRANQS